MTLRQFSYKHVAQLHLQATNLIYHTVFTLQAVNLHFFKPAH